MSVKLEVELEDKASSVADRIATKLDALADKVDRAHDRQSTSAERGAVRAARAQEREAHRAVRAQEKAAAKAATSVEREADRQTRAAEREASRQVRLTERAARAKARAQERETLRATKREAAIVAKARKAQQAEDAKTESGFLSSFKGNLAADAVSKLASLGAEAFRVAHNLGKVREQQGFIFDTFSRGKVGNMGADYLAHADALAERFGLNLEETRIQYQRLLGLKESPEQIDRLIRLGGDLQASGRSAEYVSEIYDAINQIAIKEKGSLNDIATEAISRLGVTNDDILAGLAKELGKPTATQRDLEQFFGKEGADSKRVENILLNAVEKSLGISSAGEIAAKFADETLAGMENKAWAKATLIGERFSKGLLDASRPAFTQIAQWILDLDVEKASGWGRTFAQFFGIGENTDAQKQWIADKEARQAAGTDNKVTIGEVGNGIVGMGEKLWGLFGLGGPRAAAVSEQVGKQMGAGLVKGLDSSAPAAAEAGARLTDAANSGLKDKAEIHSPSRLFMRDGLDMGAGLELGLDLSAADVQDAADRMVPTLDAEAEPAAVPVAQAAEAYAAPTPQPNPTATVAGYGGATVQVTAPISITVGGDGQTAQAVAQELRRSLRREVENMFEETALQMGASP